MYQLECSAITYIGLVREKNEDNYYVNGKFKSNSKSDTEGYSDNEPRDSYLYAVCDGMGGEALGERASLIAVAALSHFQLTDIRRTINKYIHAANRLICDEMQKNGDAQMGTTLALLYIHNGIAYAYNVGDSRVYMLRDDDLYLLTEDHTEAQQLVEMGRLRPEDASFHESRNKLTQHLGIPIEGFKIKPYISEDVEIRENDIFMVCSDGLTDMVSDDDIADCLITENANATELVKMLASKTQENGGRDNATIIVVKVL